MKILSIISLCSIMIFPQTVLPPLVKSNFKAVTSYSDLINYVEAAAESNPNITLEYFAESNEGRKLPVLFISKDKFGEDGSKLKVLIFAQQHGNEQSGKEGALLLLNKIADGKLDALFNRIDLILIPQMNPDGSEKNQRRNGNGLDLNRNHLILTEPETIGLHKIFNKYLPEMTIDVHEYFPFSSDWQTFGYIKHWDEQFGTTTNPNVSENIRNYSNDVFLPYVKNFLEEQDYSFNNYILGGPPDQARMRHSTFDINDGRQSLGILNSLSFILEGLNGQDAFAENIKRRAEGQAAALEGFLRFSYENYNEIKMLVKNEREKLLNSSEGDIVTIQMEHVRGEKPLQFYLKSVITGEDSLITVEEYHTAIDIILEAEKPAGFLIPKSNKKLLSWMENHSLVFNEYNPQPEDKVTGWKITGMDSVYLEEVELEDPVTESFIKNEINPDDYLFIPINQLKSNMLVIALEPRSMLALRTYDQFEDLVVVGEEYPVLKVLRKSN